MKPYQRGDVVIIDVPIPASGHVQGGKRPWVIVQNNMGNQFSPTSIVVPLTTKMKRLEMPTHVAFVWENLEQSIVYISRLKMKRALEKSLQPLRGVPLLIWFFMCLKVIPVFLNIRRCKCVYSFADLAFTGSNNSRIDEIK